MEVKKGVVEQKVSRLNTTGYAEMADEIQRQTQQPSSVSECKPWSCTQTWRKLQKITNFLE